MRLSRHLTIKVVTPTVLDSVTPPGGGGRGWGTPYNGLYGEAPPERGNLFQASGILKGREFTSYSI